MTNTRCFRETLAANDSRCPWWQLVCTTKCTTLMAAKAWRDAPLSFLFALCCLLTPEMLALMGNRKQWKAKGRNQPCLSSLPARFSISPYLLRTCTLPHRPPTLATLSSWAHYNDKGLWNSPDLSFSGLGPCQHFPPGYCSGKSADTSFTFSLSLSSNVSQLSFIFTVVKGHNKSSCITSHCDSRLISAVSYDRLHCFHLMPFSLLGYPSALCFLPVLIVFTYKSMCHRGKMWLRRCLL